MNFDITDVIQYGTRLLIIFTILPIHEYAHAWMAKRQGDDTALYSGRLTLNPVSHIDPIGALLLFFTGFGWAKPVPVNPLRFKKQRKGMALTALAGPVSNLICAFVGFVALKILTNTNLFNEMLVEYVLDDNYMFLLFDILYYFVIINIGLAIFNLIPIPPLDGSKILSYFTPAKFDRFIYQNQQIIYIIFIFLLVSPILSTPLGWIRDGVYGLFDLITFFIPTGDFGAVRYGM